MFLELHQDRLRYLVEFNAEEPIIDEDISSGWQEVHNYYDVTAIKANVCGLEMTITKNGKWGVYIIVNGFANDLRIYFRTKEAAASAHKKIHEWLWPPDIK